MPADTQNDIAFEPLEQWQRLPEGMTLIDTPGVAVDAQDRVFALTRNIENPVIVLDRDGNVLTTWGKGAFTARTHGIVVGPDALLYITDDGAHTVTKWTPEGELLMTIGTPGRHSRKWSGLPFCRPTQAAISARTGHIFISDGYANASVHKYTPDGTYVKTWGSPGIDPGQFMIPHNIAIDPNERLYVADREAHRVQIFDTEGRLETIWHDIHRPCGLSVAPDGNIYIGELHGVDLVGTCPGYGHRLSIYSPEGVLLTRFGAPEEGQGPGQFHAPHGIAIDSHGDVYVGEVSFTTRGSHMDPPRELRSLCKLLRKRG